MIKTTNIDNYKNKLIVTGMKFDKNVTNKSTELEIYNIEIIIK